MIDSPTIEWWALAPELALAIASMAALLVGMRDSRLSAQLTWIVGFAGLAVAATLTVWEFDTTHAAAWAGQVDADKLAGVVRMLAIAAGTATLVFATRATPPRGRHGEYVALVLAATCGMALMGASGSLPTLFVGLELFSIALYVLCALEVGRERSLEAGFKYLVLGGVASALILYGCALTYGATGSFTLTEIGAVGERGVLLHGGLGLLIAALAFKASAAPLHWWAPDVYDGAPTTITAFMATATKAAALLVTARVLVVAFGADSEVWQPVVAGIAAASIVAGNLGAIAQNELKRMLAWSSVAQAGYLLIGIVAWQETGIAALVYALVVYVAMTLGGWAIVLMRERQLDRTISFDDLKGQGWGPMAGTPWLGVLPGIALTICALSLAGIPPLGGFFAKFLLFDAAIAADYTWLAVVGIGGSIVSLAYYLRIPVALYMQKPEGDAAAHGSEPEILLGVFGVVAAAAVLAVAIVPEPTIDIACDVRAQLVDAGGPCERFPG
jgi:NADH-quinone oxidoreductase subunit N